MSLVDRFDAFQRRHPVIGFPLGVIYKFFDDSGGYLAALITYYAFVSLFPLLLLLATVLSWVLSSRPDLQEEIIESALSQFPVVGDQLGNPTALSGGTAGVIVGVLVSVYGGLGVGNAVQHALNTVWAIPRNSRPNPITVRLRSLVIVLTAGLAIVGTTTLSTLAALRVGWFGPPVSITITLLANTLVLPGVQRWAVSRRMPPTVHIAGALFAAALWQLIQTYGVVYIGRIVKESSVTNGGLGGSARGSARPSFFIPRPSSRAPTRCRGARAPASPTWTAGPRPMPRISPTPTGRRMPRRPARCVPRVTRRSRRPSAAMAAAMAAATETVTASDL